MANEKRLIDANAFIADHCEDCKYFNVNGICTKEDPVCGAVMLVNEQTTVDAVEVVHGRWEMGIDEGDYEYGTCSVCGYNEYNAFGCCLPHNYCPNCGAKMDGDGNE